MPVTRRSLLQASVGGGAASLLAGRARAQGSAPIRIGVLTDLSGPYEDTSGRTSVACTQLAADEAMAASPGLKVEVLSGDHLNKPDAALTIARQWYDRDGVDVITNCNNSAVALAVSSLTRERNKVFLGTGVATADLTGVACSPNTIHWSYDTWEIAHSTGVATVKAGGTKWFLIIADYAFGHAMEVEMTRWIRQSGGQILGRVSYPFPGTSDFGGFLLQAKASGANVVGLLNAGADFINNVKQAYEFGLTPNLRIAGTATFINDIHALGATAAQGLTYTECFYWNLNARTRAFTSRILKRTPGNYPNQIQAGDYSGTTHYLKAVAKLGSNRAKASGLETVGTMKALPTDDDAYGAGTARVDGRHLHPAYLFQVKQPGEVIDPWDLLTLLQTTPADEAFRPLAEGKCSFVHPD